MKPKVALYRDHLVEPSAFVERYAAVLKENDIEYHNVTINQPDFWDTVRSCDAFIYRWIPHDGPCRLAHSLLPVIENQLGIPCFPNQRTWWPFNDKLRQYFMFQFADFPFVKTHVFLKKAEALDWLKREANFPIVFKLSAGAASTNVILVNNLDEGGRLVKQMFGRGLWTQRLPGSGKIKSMPSKLQTQIQSVRLFASWLRNRFDVIDWLPHKNYVYFQEFMAGNAYDTRITTIGDRAFGYRRNVRKGDFRASGSGNNDYDPAGIDKDCVELAFRMSEYFGLQSAAYDFVYDKKQKPRILELSYNFNDTYIAKCHGYWSRDGRWTGGRFWPQYCQLVDLLGLNDLVQPDDLADVDAKRG